MRYCSTAQHANMPLLLTDGHGDGGKCQAHSEGVSDKGAKRSWLLVLPALCSLSNPRQLAWRALLLQSVTPSKLHGNEPAADLRTPTPTNIGSPHVQPLCPLHPDLGAPLL